MSFVTADPQVLAATAAHLRAVGSTVSSAAAAAAAPTTGVVPAGADEVSALIAAAFSSHAAMFQAFLAQASQIGETLAATLEANAGSYAGVEAANALLAG